MRSKLIFYYKTAFNTPIHVLYPLGKSEQRALELQYVDKMNLRPLVWLSKIIGIYA